LDGLFLDRSGHARSEDRETKGQSAEADHASPTRLGAAKPAASKAR
jgi:hypothetical protein